MQPLVIRLNSFKRKKRQHSKIPTKNIPTYTEEKANYSTRVGSGNQSYVDLSTSYSPVLWVFYIEF